MKAHAWVSKKAFYIILWIKVRGIIMLKEEREWWMTEKFRKFRRSNCVIRILRE